MSGKRPGPAGKDPREVAAAEGRAGKRYSGSEWGEFSLTLANQLHQSLPGATSTADPRVIEVFFAAGLGALEEIAPRDPAEGMLAGQLVATHNAAMHCLRLAHDERQGTAGRHAELALANKLMRSYATLLEALDKHRGKGRQVVRVEHVHVHAGGQAIVGAVGHPGGGGSGAGTDERSHAPGLAHEPGAPLRGEDAGRKPVPAAGGEGQEAVPDARGARRRA